MAERTFDDFDEHAQNYREVHTKNVAISGADSNYFAEMKVQMLSSYVENINLKVLDVGCGDGLTAYYMRRYFPSWNITGIDISANSIDVAKQRNISTVNFLTYDGQNIPFADQSFDVVFIAGVLHHVSFDFHKKMMGQISRVLKRGGKLFLFEHNPLNPLTKYLVRTCIFDKDARLLNFSYSKRLLQDAGFNIVNKRFIIFFPRTKIFKPLIRMEKYLGWIPLGGQYFICAQVK